MEVVVATSAETNSTFKRKFERDSQIIDCYPGKGSTLAVSAIIQTRVYITASAAT